MPSLEDGNAIQLGIAQVIRRLLLCDIEYKAAYALLYAYKLALFNLKNVRPAPYYKDVVTVDPASDPENAGDATEPCTFAELEALAEKGFDVNDETNTAPDLNDEHDAVHAGALRETCGVKPCNEAEVGAPSARFSQVGSRSSEDLYVCAPPLSPSVGDRVGNPDMSPQDDTYLPQASSARPERLSKSEGVERVSAGKDREKDMSPVGTAPMNDKKQVQRIVIPDEIQNMLNRDPHAEMTDDEFAILETALSKLTG